MPDPASTDEPLGLRIHRRNGVVRVLLSGALDVAGGRRLREELRGVSAEGVEGTLLDARDVTFVDPMGLSALLDLLHAGIDGPRTAVIGVSPPIERLLELTGTTSAPDGAPGFRLLKRFSSEEGS